MKKQELLTNLPPEIVTEILARLPVRTIISCKCVCKSWLDSIKTHYFANLHYSNSVPALALLIPSHATVHLADVEPHDLHVQTIARTISFGLDSTTVEGSADGLLLLCGFRRRECELYLCNPITREYINLPSFFRSVQEYDYYLFSGAETYGFGVSKISGQYKAVGIFHVTGHPKFECKVYTVGTGSWRNVALDSRLNYTYNTSGAFLNGKLHWLAYDLNKTLWISCFDLESEVFTTFSPPRPPQTGRTKNLPARLVAVEGCLCLCDYVLFEDIEIVRVWMMKKYGVDKSWKREFLFRERVGYDIKDFYPIRLDKENGGILMACTYFFYYVRKDGTVRLIDTSEKHSYTTSVTPSFFFTQAFCNRELRLILNTLIF